MLMGLLHEKPSRSVCESVSRPAERAVRSRAVNATSGQLCDLRQPVNLSEPLHSHEGDDERWDLPPLTRFSLWGRREGATAWCRLNAQ